jgi:hypothetical protein
MNGKGDNMPQPSSAFYRAERRFQKTMKRRAWWERNRAAVLYCIVTAAVSFMIGWMLKGSFEEYRHIRQSLSTPEAKAVLDYWECKPQKREIK